MKTIKNLFLLILITMLFAKSLIAQTLHINGIITTKTEVVKNAKILFTETDDTSKQYETFSDEFGNYNIDVITSVESTKNQLPTKFELGQNYPNPFSSETAISYKLKENTDVGISIYDVLGREVKEYNVGQQNTGVHRIIWDGRNSIGEKVATGIYFYRLKTGKETIVNKMLLSRGVDIKNSLSLNHHFVSVSELKKESGKPISFKLKIENTTNTEPRIAWKKIDNLSIENDTIINISVNKLPIANAGKDDSIKVGQYVTLDGTASQLGDGTQLSFLWQADTTNPAKVFIIEYRSETYANFVLEGTYRFTLVVNDELAVSEPDEIIIEVGEREEIVFEDPAFELEVRHTLQDATGALTNQKLATIDTLIRFGTGLKVTSIKGIENCVNLTLLLMSSSQITDLTPLSGLTKLEKLDLSQTFILTDISPLAKLENLEKLNLSSNIISDVSSLKKLTKLKELKLTYNPIDDIAAFENMTELEELGINYLPGEGEPILKNSDVISNLKKLKKLWIGHYNVGDISFMSTIGDSLIYLRLSSCNVTDISEITHCTQLVRLYLDSNNITNIEPLIKNSGLGKGDMIHLYYNPLDSISINEYIPELRKRGANVFY